MGVPVPSYTHHENGTRGFSKTADRYARFFRVSLDWLMTGRGDMKPRSARLTLPVLGKVGAGAVVDMPGDEIPGAPLDRIEITFDGDFALEVVGDSMWPRFMPGEHVVVEGEPVKPASLVGPYAVVQLHDDGTRLIKRILRSGKPDTVNLWSHNADEIKDARVMAAWRIKCVLYD